MTIGDKVILIDDDDGYACCGMVSSGTLGNIVSIDGDYVSVLWEDKEHKNNDSYYEVHKDSISVIG